jgi:hypothetical protein
MDLIIIYRPGNNGGFRDDTSYGSVESNTTVEYNTNFRNNIKEKQRRNL